VSASAACVRVTPLARRDPLSVPELSLELTQKWMVWDAWVSGQRRVDVHPIVLSAAAHAEAIATAERAGAVIGRAADRAATDPEERARYRLHPDVERLAAAARKAGDLGALSRVDLLLRSDGRFVACEINADCPGGHNETLALPRLARAAGLRGLYDPTTVTPRLADRLVAMSGGPGSPRGAIGLVFATAYADDLQICALLQRMIKERGGRAHRVPATAPTENDKGELVFRGNKLAVLYRFYPLEYMEEQKNIDAIARATERGDLACMSTFASIHAQSKLAMARAFVHEPDEARAVLPETVALADVHPQRIAAEREQWVVKRDLSRVGDHVLVGSLFTHEEFALALAEVAEAEREGDVWIAQRFVPQRAIATPWGDRYLTLGVYLLDGRFAGYFARLSTTVLCAGEALVLPVFVAEGGGGAA
jgi:glutathionylspermidine synthase